MSGRGPLLSGPAVRLGGYAAALALAFIAAFALGTVVPPLGSEPAPAGTAPITPTADPAHRP